MTGDTDWRRAFNGNEICDPVAVGTFSEIDLKASIVRRRARLDGGSISCRMVNLARQMLISRAW